MATVTVDYEDLERKLDQLQDAASPRRVNRLFSQSLKIQAKKTRKELAKLVSRKLGVKRKDAIRRLRLDFLGNRIEIHTAGKFNKFLIKYFRLTTRSALTGRPAGGLRFSGAHGHRYVNPQGFYAKRKGLFFERRIRGGVRVSRSPIDALFVPGKLTEVYASTETGLLVEKAGQNAILRTYAKMNREYIP